MDGGAWWTAVYGVAQSWTRLMRLSSSSSRPHFSLLASLSDPAASSSLEPRHLWVTTVMGATWDLPGKTCAGEPLKQATWA